MFFIEFAHEERSPNSKRASATETNPAKGVADIFPSMHDFFNQRIWRTVGAAALAIAGVMAWYGDTLTAGAGEARYVFAYWAALLLFVLLALYMAFIDIRYIRLQYRLEQRDLFTKTLGAEKFRTSLKKGQGQPTNGNQRDGAESRPPE